MTTLRKTTTAFTALVLGLCLTAASALADHRVQGSLRVDHDASDFELARVAKVVLADAVAATLKAQPGVAVKAELEEENGYAVWEIEVVTPDRRLVKVLLDAGDGKILLTVPKS